ncbi:MAG: hypothetical protein ACI8RZ_003821 [Myxococcota bacterium]|jgi:hypothetical protein
MEGDTVRALMMTSLVAWAAGCSEHNVGNFNTAPAASIASPKDGAVYAAGATIELAGKVSDSQGVEALVVTWTSSLDGELGTTPPDASGLVYLGVSSLSQGSHVITLSVEDDGLLSSSDAITIGIGAGAQDLDGDGFTSEIDCDDLDAAVNPDAEDIAWDDIDQDCSGSDLHDYVALSAGGWFTCGVTTLDDLICWGSDYFGQTSDAPDGVFEGVEGGGNHACALKSTGSGTCWGIDDSSDGDYGQVTDASAGPYVAISAGAAHTCGVEGDGSVTCWGWDEYYQASSIPAGDYERISAGSFHTCGVTTKTEVLCWGSQDGGSYDAGQVDGAPTARGYTDVGSGYLHACALDNSGGLTCWGLSDGTSSDEGQVSDAPTTNGYTALSVGLNHACALDPSGVVDCWGDNVEGQVSGAPDEGGYIAIAAGSHHTCALDGTGQAECWGDDSAGQSSPP